MSAKQARELIRALERNPGLREELQRVLQDSETTPSPAGTNGSQSAERERLLFEALRQMARNTEDQTRAIANLAKGVGAIQGTARSYREWQGVWRDMEDIGQMLLVGGAIAGCAVFALVLTLITLKNALVNALSDLNPFDRQQQQEAIAQFQQVDAIPTLLKDGSVLGYSITSGFGMRTHPITGQQREHNGADIALDSGTPLYVATSTTVDCLNDPNGFGIYARYAIDDQKTVILAHLSHCLTGSFGAGEVIAYSGNSGLSDGPHLHLQLEDNDKPVMPTIDLAIATLKPVPLEDLNNLIAAFYPAIVSQESNGDHTATNDASGDLAIGKTQVMEYNIANWSRQALGYEVNQAEFLNSPELQKQISLYEMFQIAAEQFDRLNPEGTLRRMAAVWYSGDAARVSDYSAIPNQPDSPSVGEYVDQVMARIQGESVSPAPASSPIATPTPTPSPTPTSPQTSAAEASVLCVRSTDAVGQDLGCGSGVAVSATEVITNYHVIEHNGKTTPIQTATGQKAIAQIIRTAPQSDLALLRVTDVPLTPARWGDSAAVQEGERVTAIGYPYQQRKTTPLKILKRQAPCDRPDGLVSSEDQCLQVSKGLHPGNSGGALVNGQGEVIGINRAIQKATGLGVAIPAIVVQQFVEGSTQ